MPESIERARFLYEQKRYDLAIIELRRQLSNEPEDASAHCLLATCLASSNSPKEALAEAIEALHLAPDMAFTHYTYGFVLVRQNKLQPAEQALKQAIELDPYAPWYYALLAQIRLELANWKGALEASDMGLALQADNVTCTNCRSQALMKLGRTAEALVTIDTSLRLEPDNALSHANKGWALLEARQNTEALGHFREALRIEPRQEWARRGMITALKSRYLVYRVVLGYFFWMSRLPRNTRYAIIGGAWALNMVRISAQNNPVLTPWCRIIGGVYLLFCFTSWTADPLFNATLRFNPYARYLLTRKQVLVSNCVAATFLTGVLSLVVWLFRQHDGELALGFGSLFLTYLIAMASRSTTRWVSILIGVLLGLLAVLVLVMAAALGA